MALVPPRYFPLPQLASRYGIIAWDGELTVEWLLDAYRHGIFPWPMGYRLAWWSPDPRAIFEFEHFHVSKRLARRIKSGQFRVTHDLAFRNVVRTCATVDDRRGRTWITPQLAAGYDALHAEGHAHSIEVWRNDRLVGGTFGVAVGGLFAAESMFHTETDASKVALAHLVGHLPARGFTLLDIQQLTPHTASLGAIEVPRAEYLARLERAVGLNVEF